jgi:hypothetical protein
MTLMLVWLAAMACNLPLGVVKPQPQSASSPAATAAASQPQAPASSVTATPEDYLLQPDPLDHLLRLRSIEFNLTTTRPDGTSRSLDGEIDSAGNMDLKFNYKGFDLTGLPQGFDTKWIPTEAEVFVLGGKGYQPDEQNPDWKNTPFDDDYVQTLSQELHGMDGPSLWLNLLPPGSIKPAGNETVGGFAADKYSIAGSVDGETITGTIWEEPQADALVQAELHIPAALLSAPDQPQPGEMIIILKAQKAEVNPVTLANYQGPLATQGPQPTQGPLPTQGPQPTASSSQSNLPSDIPRYPGATESGNAGMPMTQMQTTDPAAKVAQFYTQQMGAENWTLTNTSPAGNAIVQSWEKDNRMADIMIMSSGGTTQITITVTNQ